MIVQITITRNELFLLKEMLPLWQKYADAFVFMDDNSTDGTYEYLMENKDKFNILSVMKSGMNRDDISTQIESEVRQRLYDEAFKYSGNIICLDTDEYIDGQLSKEQLNQIMDNNKDMLFHMRWIQYTGENQIRIDGPWKVNYKDRVASYSTRALFKNAQMHSEHLPVPQKQAIIEIPNLFIAHLQWLCKNTVAVKQYFWKITDYVVNNRFGVQTTHPSAYDASVNNFNWQYESFLFPLKVDPKIYDKHDIKSSYKYLYIKENIEKYNIPNLNDWGMEIH
jgi:hypothetical protein